MLLIEKLGVHVFMFFEIIRQIYVRLVFCATKKTGISRLFVMLIYAQGITPSRAILSAAC